MDVANQRRAMITETLNEVHSILSDGATESALQSARTCMLKLAGRRELFPRSDFPLPDAGSNERTFLIHEDEDGSYGLYVNSWLHGQTYRPYDHESSWAIAVAVEGDERHRVYRHVDDGAIEGMGEVEVIDEVDVTPGSGICLPENGIHSIHALGEEPLLHLHLYGKAFAHQSTRTKYDMEKGTTHAFKLRRLDFTRMRDESHHRCRVV